LEKNIQFFDEAQLFAPIFSVTRILKMLGNQPKYWGRRNWALPPRVGTLFLREIVLIRSALEIRTEHHSETMAVAAWFEYSGQFENRFITNLH